MPDWVFELSHEYLFKQQNHENEPLTIHKMIRLGVTINFLKNAEHYISKQFYNCYKSNKDAE